MIAKCASGLATLIAFLAYSPFTFADTINLTPTDDALVLTQPSSRVFENWGAAPFLQVFSGQTEGAIDFSFLRFDLSSIHGTVTSLRLHLRQVSSPGTSGLENPTLVGLFHVANDNWREGAGIFTQNTSPDPLTGITGFNFGQPFLNNLNKATDRLATANVTTLGQDVVFDFSGFNLSADRADGFLTVAVTLDDVDQFHNPRTLIDFSSKEGSAAPFLEVRTVPEPSTLTLLGIGAAGLIGYGWRRAKRAGAAVR